MGIVADPYSVCASITGNSVASSGADAVPPVGGGQDIRLRQRQATTFRLRGCVGGAPDDPALSIFFMPTTPPGAPRAIASHSTGFTSPGGAACTAPTTG